MAELLLELFSEEIPARMQTRAADDLKSLVTNGLVDAGLTYEGARAHATPRRLVLSVQGLASATAATREERKGPRTDAPEQAIQGFLKSAGVSLEQCRVQEDKKGKFLIAVTEKPGRATADLIAELIPRVIREFPWPKSMRWGASSLRWVRPLKSILCVFDGEVVPFTIETIASGDSTQGHRFLSPKTLRARHFDDYAGKLEAAHVIVDGGQRADIIRAEAQTLAFARGLSLVEDEALLKETAGLVEWPVVLMGAFDAGFLAVPPEVIITAIKTHQKCFALRNRDGSLAHRYLLVSNMLARDGGNRIIAGNNKVIAARLSDAKFFWEQDLKTPLAQRLPALDAITFHARLGSQGERVARIVRLAGDIARAIGADAGQAEQAARLAKADLVTGMVGEFPELQGLMGRYYALAEGVAPDVADAIRDHYKPQGPGDTLPVSKVGMAVSLADKIDTLAGFWAIEETPTGSKDPYGLRRAALGVIRMILEGQLRLNLGSAIRGSRGGYDPQFISASARKQMGDSGGSLEEAIDRAFKVVSGNLIAFFADRLKVYLREQGKRHDLIDAVFALGDQDDLLMIVRRVEALQGFLETEDGLSLLAGVKRAANILKIEEKKDGRGFEGLPNSQLLIQGEEKALYTAVNQAAAQAHKAVEAEDFVAAMAALARLRAPVDAFFEKVTVNSDDPSFRENRLKLLNRIRAATLSVADFSRIEG